jgi:3'-5' exoribonuclease
MSRIWVEKMEVGQQVEGVYAVTSVTLRSYHSGEFLALRLADKTGKISAICWQADQNLFRAVSEAGLVEVKGKIQRYQGKPQLTLDKIQPVSAEVEVDGADFLPISPEDPEEVVNLLRKWRDSLHSEYYRKLWDLFFEDEENFEKFKKAPAGKRWHHSYIGGLLEHTESLIRLCDSLSALYQYLNRDLLLTGALFHDVGKARELVYDTSFEYSDEGRLVGHIVLGARLVREYIDQIEDFPGEQTLLVEHLILSHQGETPESPRMPRCREAVALHQADMIDSQLSAFTREMNKPEAAGARWTDFIRLIGRQIYRSEADERNANENAEADGKT